MSFIEYLCVYNDSGGCSHFETLKIGLTPKNYAPPAAPLNTSSQNPAQAMVFLELPVGWFGDWHPTPFKQWLVLISGECEIETGDGNTCRRKAGDVILLADTEGQGHRTRVVGDVPVQITAVHFR